LIEETQLNLRKFKFYVLVYTGHITFCSSTAVLRLGLHKFQFWK